MLFVLFLLPKKKKQFKNEQSDCLVVLKKFSQDINYQINFNLNILE